MKIYFLAKIKIKGIILKFTPAYLKNAGYYIFERGMGNISQN